MTTFVGYESGLVYLLTCGRDSERVFGTGRHAAPTRSRPQKGVRPPARLIAELGFPPEISTDVLDVCVADASARSQSALLRCHVWNGPDRGTWLRIDNEYFVCTPEACFMQMASALPLEHLIELGYLLCGTYAPLAVSTRVHSGLLPLTSVSKLEKYCSRMDGCHAVTKARRALRYIQDGSASVMETRLAMLLCLPAKLGGWGLPKPLLNHELKLPSSLDGRTASARRRPDLYWPSGKTGLEYESRLHHAAEARRAADMQRGNELEALGVRLLGCTFQDLRNPLALERLARQVARMINFRLRTKASDADERRWRLHQLLLGNGEWELLRLDTAKEEGRL